MSIGMWLARQGDGVRDEDTEHGGSLEVPDRLEQAADGRKLNISHKPFGDLAGCVTESMYKSLTNFYRQ